MAKPTSKKSPFHQQIEAELLRQSVETLAGENHNLASILAPEYSRYSMLQKMDADSLWVKMEIQKIQNETEKSAGN